MLVLLGPPGAGKGTQAERLADRQGLLHLSTGDLFRQHLSDETELGIEARSYMARGELVPDETVIGMVRKRLAEPDAAGGVVFDGFPRTVAQAEALDGLLEELGHEAPWAVGLVVDRSELVQRLTRRRVCRAEGHIYHLDFKPPREPGVCDIDGSELYQREDDTLETVERRLDVYEEETRPVLEYYSERDRLSSVAGQGAPEEVAQRVKEVVQELSE